MGVVEIFEETVVGGYSCVNTRLAFDTLILLPNLDNPMLYNSMINKNLNYKVVYNLKFDKKRVITKNFKLDENNHYGNRKTKPLPTGCIKDDSDTS